MDERNIMHNNANIKYKAKIAEALKLFFKPNEAKVWIWGIPPAITDADIMTKNQYRTPVQCVGHEFCQNFNIIENGNRYVFMSCFKKRFETSRYIYILGVKCRATHEEQDGPYMEPDLTWRVRYLSDHTATEKYDMRPEKRPNELTAWAPNIFKENSQSDDVQEVMYHQNSEANDNEDVNIETQLMIVSEDAPETVKDGINTKITKRQRTNLSITQNDIR